MDCFVASTAFLVADTMMRYLSYAAYLAALKKKKKTSGGAWRNNQDCQNASLSKSRRR